MPDYVKVDARVAEIRAEHFDEIDRRISSKTHGTCALVMWTMETFEIDLITARCLIEGHPGQKLESEGNGSEGGA